MEWDAQKTRLRHFPCCYGRLGSTVTPEFYGSGITQGFYGGMAGFMDDAV